MSATKATLIGLVSILFWSASVGSIRIVTQMLGPLGGASLLYTASSLFLYLSFGFPKLSTFPRTYLYVASVLFCAYEICFSLSLGYAADGRQTVELGMVNYLWPSLTVAMAILFNGQKAHWIVIPGMAMALFGICLILGGDDGLSLAEMGRNIGSNPLSYGLAFAGALLWSAYCTVTSRMAEGKNGVTFFFMLTTLALWAQYLLGDNPPLQLSLRAVALTAIAGSILAFGYAAWNIGILHGNVTLLSAASYFIPVFSSLLTVLMVGASLSLPFWKGCVLVTAGSLLCWLAVSLRSPGKAKSGPH